ncbi:MAG: FHA domain-containing protein [Bdellovibrionia bacterium]
MLLLDQQPYLIGRQGSGLQLFDPSVSRIHCYFVLEGDRVYVGDEGSMNGTYIEGGRVSKKEIFKGTLIQMGVYNVQILDTPQSLYVENPPQDKAKEPEKLNVFANPVVPQTPPPFDGMPFSLEEILFFFQQAFFYPHKFFRETRFRGRMTESLTVIAAGLFCGHLFAVTRTLYYLISGGVDPSLFFRVLFGTFALVLISTSFSVLFTLGLSFVLDRLHSILETGATLSQYLRFFAYAAVIFAALQLVSALTLGFLQIIVTMFLVGWVTFGLIRAFDPNPAPMVGAVLLYVMIWIVVQVQISAMFKPMLFLPRI